MQKWTNEKYKKKTDTTAILLKLENSKETEKATNETTKQQ